MSTHDDPSGRNRSVSRPALLFVAALVVSNVIAAALVDRDPGLGFDEVSVIAVAGVITVLLEYGVFRRQKRQ